MEALERENAARVARGAPPRRLHDEWVNRPRLREHERALWHDFMMFSQFCGGDPRPADAVAWFDLQNVAQEERWWLSKLFSTLAGVARERTATDE